MFKMDLFIGGFLILVLFLLNMRICIGLKNIFLGVDFNIGKFFFMIFV